MPLYSSTPRSAGVGDKVVASNQINAERPNRGGFTVIPRGAVGVVVDRRPGMWKTHRVRFPQGTFWVSSMQIDNATSATR